jgi:hypothetical protein
MPPGLEALQRAMAANILDPSARIPLDWFALPTWADPAVRIGVYVGGYPARIPEAQMVRSEWPVLALCESRHQERESIDLDLEGENEPVLVNRVDFEVVTESIDEPEAQAFEHLRAGGSLGEAMASFARSAVAPDRVTQLFARWVSLGLIRQCG